MVIIPGTKRARLRHVGVALLTLMAILAVSVVPTREAGAQSAGASKKAKKAKKATKRPVEKQGAEEAPPRASDAGEGSAAPTPEAAGPPPPPVEHESVKLANGSEVEVDKWGETFPAYDYRPPIDIEDKRIHVVLDSQRDGAPRVGVSSLQIDSEGGKFYWCDASFQQSIQYGPDPGRGSGRVMRAHLDGTGVETLASARRYPRSLVLDKRRGRIYWMEGIGLSICTLQSAALDGREEVTLSRGLHQPFGLALDSARGQLYYWEESRIVRINTDGTGEEVVTADPDVAHAPLMCLRFDAARDKLFGSMGIGGFRWFDKDGTHVGELSRPRQLGSVGEFALDEVHQKIYYASNGITLKRANPDGSQTEVLVVAPRIGADGFVRRLGKVVLDPARGQLWWTCARNRGVDGINDAFCRMALPPLPVPTARPAPPRIASFAPAEQAAGGKITIAGAGLAETVAVAFIDDSTGAHTVAKFQALGDDRVAVTVPRLGERCKRPVIVVRTPSGVTMTLGTDILAPKLEDLPGGLYRHERSAAGAGKLWFRPGVRAGDVEVAVVYATGDSHFTFGPKGMITAFAKNEGTASFEDLPAVESVVYHEPFAHVGWPLHHDKSVTVIPVLAIRPSFPEQPFRYRADGRPAD